MLSFMRMLTGYHPEDDEPLGTLSAEGRHCISFVTQNAQFSWEIFRQIICHSIEIQPKFRL